VTDTPLVSVVIPCLNYGEFLPAAIESVLGQSYPAVELIVVDYGSSDNTAAVAAANRDVRYLSRPNRGLGSARNDGLTVAKGPFVVFLDADDKLVPDAVATSVACLEGRLACAFAYGHQRYFDASGPAPQRGPPPAGCLPDEEDPYAWMLRMNSPLRSVGAIVYRRAYLEEVAGFATDLQACHDLDLNLRLVRNRPICCNDRVVLMSRAHHMNMTRRTSRMLVNAVSAQRRQRPYVDAHPVYREPYRAGIRLARSYWGGRLANEIMADLAERSHGHAARQSLTLARWYPRGLVTVAGGVCSRVASRLRRTASTG
jgi:glycosyltransferase involved in cell wall biosynthesis